MKDQLIVDVVHDLHQNTDFVFGVENNRIHRIMLQSLYFVQSFDVIQPRLTLMNTITNENHELGEAS